MSDSDSDFGDCDFISAAASNVQLQWSDTRLSLPEKSTGTAKKYNQQDDSMNSSTFSTNDENSFVKPPVSDTSPSPVPAKKAKPATKKGGRRSTRKSAANESIEIPDDDNVNVEPTIKENITPPSSPRAESSPASFTKSGKPRAVRGANRTKKTDQALRRIEMAQEEEKNRKKSKKENPLLKLWNKSLNDSSIVIDDSDMVEVKILWKAKIHRVEVKSNQRLGQLMDNFAKSVDLKSGEVGFLDDSSNEYTDNTRSEKGNLKWMDREILVEELNLNAASILKARCIDEEKAESMNTIEVKVQTQDRKASVQIKILKMDPMRKLMETYAQLKQLDASKLKFFFDGEELNADETGEDLDLEGDECFDVHTVS